MDEKIKKMVSEIISYPSKQKDFKPIITLISDSKDKRYDGILYVLYKLDNLRIRQETDEYGVRDRKEARMKQLINEYNKLYA